MRNHPGHVRREAEDRLLAENQKLQEELREAREALDAIRSGAVDALVVSGPEGDKVFTLSGAERPYRLLFETVSEGALTLTADGAILFANRRFAEMVKRPLEEIITAPLSDFVSPPDAHRVSAVGSQAGDHSLRLDVVLKAADGGELPVRLSCRALGDTSAQVCVVVTDLSDTRAAETLRASEVRFHGAMDNIMEGCQIIGRDWHYLYINDAAQRHNRRPKEELLGRNYKEMWPGIETSPVFAKMRRCMETGEQQVLETEFTFPDGEVRWFDLGIVRIPEGIFILSMDITDRRHAQQELAQAAKLRDDLLSLVNHEYANVLMNMKLALSLLKLTEEAAPDETRKHSYQVLERAVENLKTYTSNFLNLHRLESGRFELNLQPTSVRSVVLDALVTLRPMAEAKQQSLRVLSAFPDELPIAVRADRDCLSLIITNLVSNAIKYTPEVGSITIRLSLIGAGREQSVEVAIQDTGIGIAAEELEHIKENFYRTEEGKQTAQGFGVGLKVVTDLLAQHGSELKAESEPGKGSTFRFRLPVWGGSQPEVRSKKRRTV